MSCGVEYPSKHVKPLELCKDIFPMSTQPQDMKPKCVECNREVSVSATIIVTSTSTSPLLSLPGATSLFQNVFSISSSALPGASMPI